MPAAFWGAVTAISWGSADFLARFTGGRLGLLTALCGMMGASCLLLLAYALASGMAWVAPAEDWWSPLGAGLFLVVGTLLLYWGLVRGPVSVVAPIVAAYPVFSLSFALIEGLRPDLVQWLAMAGVLLGVVAVARYGREADAAAQQRPGGLGATVAMALASAFTVALGIWFLQRSQPIYGELQSLIVVRVFGALSTLLLLLMLPGQRRPVPWRWWPVLALQGLLDGGAYLALQLGSRGPDATIAVVVASTFCVVPVLLARLVLHEAIALPQWAGIVLVVASVAVLSA
jgi:drug/metabolite transporter (DMT)-like permease